MIPFYQLHPQFDWEFYISMYPDLKKSNINTQEKAIRHYLKHGLKENRRTHLVIPEHILSIPIPFGTFTDMVKQVSVSKGLITFKERIENIFQLETYHNPNQPSFFFGFYTDEDLTQLVQHKHLSYLIWGGEDCNLNKQHSLFTVQEMKHLPQCIHIAISRCIQKSLSLVGISSILVDFNLVDKSLFFPRNEKGTSIFIYNGQYKGREIVYGKDIYEKVKKELSDFTFVESNVLNVPHSEMPNIYAKCFIALRLTYHDGNANMVQECQAMNIPVVHNQSEYGLKWIDEKDVIKWVREIHHNLQ